MNLEIIIGIALGLILATVIYAIWRFLRSRNLKRSIGRSLLLVKVPKENLDNQSGRDFKTEINRFEQLLGNLAGLKETMVFEVAVPHVGEEIHFYLSVPKKYSEVAAKQVQGLWNGASVENAPDDYNIFNPQGTAVAAYIKQKENYILPIRTYLEIEADTANPILGGFSKVSEVGEGAGLQILIRPAPKSVKKTLRKGLDSLKKGASLESILGAEWGQLLKGAVNPKKKEEKEDVIVDEEAVKALTAKMSKPLFTVNARIMASAPSPLQANDVLEGIAAGFEQFASPARNDFRIVKPRSPKALIRNFIFRNFDNSQAMVLTSEEIASVFHFPTPFTETPRIKWLKSKEAPAPADTPVSGTYLGDSTFRGEKKPIYITDDDRRRHVYIIGQTGTGKSVTLKNMFVEDIRHGKGGALIDPHGDLVEGVLEHIPKERAEDVIVFDPGDLQHPLGMNMLDYNLDRPEERTFIVNEMQSIFNKLFPPESMGPMFEQYMRNALLLLMEDSVNEPATLIEVPRVFTDVEFRNRKLARIKNAVVLDFWQKEAVKAGGEASLANMTPYITSKFNNFISNDYLRPIIGQSKSAFNFRAAMDEGKIILVNLSKGRIGDINASLLGMVITGKILMAALSRVDTPDMAKRRDFSLYIDEFQNFATDSISTILSEARKYGLSLTMAHQFIAQLEEGIRDAVFGNVGTQMVFRVGAQDAEFLVKQFEPVFNENDLVNIDNLNAHVKLLIKGQTSKPFNMHVNFLPQGSTELAGHLKEYSRLKYGMDRAQIEDEIYQRLRG
jgi:hypothetical protein